MPKIQVLVLLILFFTAPRFAHADRITDVSAGVAYDSNVSNGQLASDIKRDSNVWASLSGGWSFDMDDDKSLSVTGDLAGHTFNRFTGLNNLTVGATVSHRMKLGLGRMAPWLRT